MSNYDTIGAMTALDDSAYEAFHTVGLHVHIGPTCRARRGASPSPPTPAERRRCLEDSHMTYFHGGHVVTRINGSAFRARGGLPAREFPQEPMYLPWDPPTPHGPPPSDVLW